MAEKSKEKTLAGKQTNPETGVTIYGLVLSAKPEGKKIKRLNLPPLLKAGMIPVGQAVSGELVAVVDNFTGKEDMRGSKCLHLKHASGTEYMLPLTGVIKKCLPEPEKKIGKKFYFTRLPDGVSAKYKKPMFQFDVFEETE